MPIKTLSPWFGGKRSLAPEIVRECGDHNGYWEPFCGGVAVIFAKPRCRQECLNDLHGDLTNLAMVVASNSCIELYERATRALYSQGFYDACLTEIRKPTDFADSSQRVEARHVDRAFHYLALSWMGRNGAAGTERITYQFTQRYTNNGGDSATRWRKVSESIPAWHERLRGVVISRLDAFDLIPKIEDVPGCVIYLDPPYLDEGDAYLHKFNTASGGIFAAQDDHERLAELARAKKRTRIIVSYYDHPRLSELYPGWTIRRLNRNKALAAQNKRGNVRSEAPEVLIINGPSFAESA